jgi:hypothetical protein
VNGATKEPKNNCLTFCQLKCNKISMDIIVSNKSKDNNSQTLYNAPQNIVRLITSPYSPQTIGEVKNLRKQRNKVAVLSYL